MSATAGGQDTSAGSGADVVSSSDAYARRFSGAVGRFFLDVQARATLDLLAPFPRCRVLEVGGGHGQLTGALVEAGHEVTVLGSDPACETRVRPWTADGRARFVTGDLLSPGFPDGSFDVVLCYRLLPHVGRWPELVAALARLASRAVIVDYPTRRSVNALADLFFGLKKGVEQDTRPFVVFREGEITGTFAAHGWRETGRRPQFFWPMALHRATGSAGLARGLEGAAAAAGLTRWLGSPVVLRVEPAQGRLEPAQERVERQRAEARRPQIMTTSSNITSAPGDARRWAVALFRRSVLKQRKLAEITALLGPTEGLRCLDLGSDNGVVSLLLRERGGRWASGDLTEQAVASIRSLVADDVHLVSGDRLPFPDASFDRVAVVDMLEHVTDDAAFARELARVTRPGGRLVVNTPHLKRTALRRLRHALGQTDEKHGHLRPGYTAEGLAALLAPAFAVERTRTYSRFFSEAVDTGLNWGIERLGKKSSAKGMVVTGDDLARHRKLFRAYGLVYPFVWTATRFDAIVPASGYMLAAVARRL